MAPYQDVNSWDTVSLVVCDWDSDCAASAMAAPLSSATKLFGGRVRDRRTALGISQEELARRSGLHWTFVGQVERGQRNLSLHNILKLAKGLDIDPADLVTSLAAPT